jgi:hypothetical protein
MDTASPVDALNTNSRPAASRRPASLRPFLAILTLMALATASPALGSAKPTKLYGAVKPAAISLRSAKGKTISRLRPGIYLFIVRDRSSNQNFHLLGKTVDRSTTRGFVGSAKWRVRLTAGRYTFESDRADTLQGEFTVR